MKQVNNELDAERKNKTWGSSSQKTTRIWADFSWDNKQQVRITKNEKRLNEQQKNKLSHVKVLLPYSGDAWTKRRIPRHFEKVMIG